DCYRCARHHANRGPGLSTLHRRIGKPPGSMLDDYAARVWEGVVAGGVIAGIIVLIPAANYLLLDNIAVSPRRLGSGLGRRLLAFTGGRGIAAWVSRNPALHASNDGENQRLYASIGYEETGGDSETGYGRVFMRKQRGGSVTRRQYSDRPESN